jgi:hypothetical protein
VSEEARIVFSGHADDMIVERNIERDWVHETIRSPDFVEVDPSRPGVKRAFRRISERGNRVLRVAYVESADAIRVVTLFFDRGRRA